MNKCNKKNNRLHIPEDIKLRLWIKSGGRCAICNESLYQDGFTLAYTNLADIAHIIANSEKWTRGSELSKKYRIDYDNLIMLCKKHHKVVDADGKQWPEDKLKYLKNKLERRIETLHKISPNLKTHSLIIKSNIGVNKIQVSNSEINEAIFDNGMYPEEEEAYTIDLTGDKGEGDDTFYLNGARIISDSVTEFLQIHNAANEKNHISIFGLALMPFLVYFGKQLGDKHPTQLFQHSRNDRHWKWMNTQEYQQYIINKPTILSKDKNVFLVLALSDYIKKDKYANIPELNTNVYEITVDRPTTEYLINKNQIPEFHAIYRSLLNEIQATHGKDCVINLIMAVPCPIAIQCGLSLLRKDPEIIIYDYNLTKGLFKTLKIQN